MENKNPLRAFVPILLVFLMTNAFFLSSRSLAFKWDLNSDVLIIGNLILFAATSLSFYFYYKAIRNNNVPAFLRMIYSGMFLKMLICLFAAFIYIITAETVSKSAIFGCMFLYFLYTFIEIAILMKLSKQSKNA